MRRSLIILSFFLLMLSLSLMIGIAYVMLRRPMAFKPCLGMNPVKAF